MSLLIHLGEISKWKSAIGNAKNLRKSNELCKIEIVANGEAIVALKKKIAENLGLKEELENLKSLNVEIKACKNSLRTFDLNEEDLLEDIVIIKAAVVEILERQQKGYSYLRV